MGGTNTPYVAKRASTLANPSTLAIFLQADNSALAAFVGVPQASGASLSILDGAPFRIRASGKVTIGAGGTSTFLPGIHYSAAARTQITAGTIVAGVASTALAASTTYPWLNEYTGVWDSTSLVLTGWYSQIIGIASGFTSPAIHISNFTAAVNLATNGAGFVCAATMGSSQTGTVVTLKSFVLEVL